MTLPTMLLVLQQVAPPTTTGWPDRTMDILTTVLLTLLVGITTWALRTVQGYRAQLTRKSEDDTRQFQAFAQKLQSIEQQVRGVDGQNGHASELRQLRGSFRKIERYVIRLGARLERVEEKVGVPRGEPEPFAPDDDAEGD